MITYHVINICYEIKVDGRFVRGWDKRCNITTSDIEAIRNEKKAKHKATKVYLTYEEIPTQETLKNI